MLMDSSDTWSWQPLLDSGRVADPTPGGPYHEALHAQLRCNSDSHEDRAWTRTSGLPPHRQQKSWRNSPGRFAVAYAEPLRTRAGLIMQLRVGAASWTAATTPTCGLVMRDQPSVEPEPQGSERPAGRRRNWRQCERAPKS
jgi:hypothetical protein